MALSLPILLLPLLACRNDLKEDTGPIDTGSPAIVDADQDGYGVDEDCDDADPAVNPEAEEACNGVDDDCDGEIDEDLLETFYEDADEDGQGDPATAYTDCPGDQERVTNGDDCDDADPQTYLGAAERCDDKDNDCDGAIDEDVESIWYADADADGFGDAASAYESCDPPGGWVADATDCDDLDATSFPGGTEVCDDADNNCDGSVDEGVLLTFYADTDGDGWGDEASPVQACEDGSGTVADAGDCDDSDPAVSPDAEEVCNGVDDDCDGTADQGAADASTWYADGDSDGYGDPSVSTASCEAPSGTVSDASDCDDSEAAVNPGASEICNATDDDCDGLIDDEDSSLTGADTWYRDADGDGYGDAGFSTESCAQPTGYGSDDSDCDDLDADVSPAGAEICNGVDDDCDGDVDDDDDSVDSSTLSTWYADGDGDGYGDPDTSTASCEAPSSYGEDDSDCDDSDGAINPDAVDECDGVDNDCDGVIDPDGVDSDGDGTNNCIDSTVWSDDFESGSWGSWTTATLGGSNPPDWYMTGAYLYEASNAASSAAIGPDLGELSDWTATVDVYWTGSANNGGGIVFDYVDTSNYWIARWLDPQDYYGYYTMPGRIDLYRCEAGSCSVLDTDDESTDLSVSTGVWSTFSVSIAGEDISIALDGVSYLTYTASGESPIGAGSVGVWTYDNDGGVYYDNFEVSNP